MLDRPAIIALQDDYKSHFIEKLSVVTQEGTTYFYLFHIKIAEHQIKTWVEELTKKRADHTDIKADFKAHIESSIKGLNAKIPNFDQALFREERTRLYDQILKKSLFLLTGRPGAGKTFEVRQGHPHSQLVSGLG